MIFAYLRRRARLRRVLLLIDARRGVMDSDRQVMALLDQAAVSYGLVLTKADELKPAQRAAAIAAAGQEAVKHTAALAEVQLTSALEGDGIPGLRLHLADLA
jgi:GTP-binding protein